MKTVSDCPPGINKKNSSREGGEFPHQQSMPFLEYKTKIPKKPLLPYCYREQYPFTIMTNGFLMIKVF